MSYLGDSRIKASRLQVKSLSASLDLYYLDTGRYPSTAEGLKALVERPATATNWSGNYLDGSTLPPDPWGRPYQYRYPGLHRKFDLYSLGPAGLEGDAQMVTNWDQ
jgi:general secretion pathway protein G